MKPTAVGRLQIQAIVEVPQLAMPFAQLLRDCPPELLDAERDWIEPRCGDLRTGTAFLSFHSYLVQTTRHRILIDTCIGNDKERVGFAPFHRRSGDWLQQLRAAGSAPEQIDYVLCTHLHSDHVGWNTRLIDGRWVPTFPNARYIFAKAEFEHRQRDAQSADNSAMAFADSILPVVAAGQAQLVSSDFSLDDEVSLQGAAGHTPGNVVVQLKSRGAAAVMSGDVMHHPIQVRHPEYSSRFCEDPVEAARFRSRFVEQHADSGTLLLPAHFATPTAGHVRRDRRGGYRFAFIDDVHA